MYKISYEKCVCFLFLVILAILSCSGFRIDNLAMTDISKRNSITQQEDSLFINRLIGTTPILINPYRHRIRHHRQLRNHQLHNLAVMHRSIPIKIEQFNQSSTPLQQQEQRPIRLQRSSSDSRIKNRRHHHHHHHHQQQQQQCPEDDAAWKAYIANTIVLASVESMSSERQVNYTVVFRVLKRIKNNAFPVDHIKLVFASNDTRSNRQYHHQHHHNNKHHHNKHQCEHSRRNNNNNNNNNNEDDDDDDNDDDNNENNRPQQRQHLVKAKIDKSKEYFVFLNAYSAHNYSAIGAPELRRKRVLQIINKVANSHFKPRQVDVVELEKKQNHENRNKRLKLVCRVKGFPIPRILWKRDNIDLHSNRKIKITYKKRKSTLVIRNLTDSDMGRYECLARGVDGSRASKQIIIEKETNLPSEKPDSGTPCDEKMKQDYCLNGGTCRYLDALGEYYCVCATGYTGKQCAEKSSDQSSMYRQTPIYTCKIGLYTKYDNC